MSNDTFNKIDPLKLSKARKFDKNIRISSPSAFEKIPPSKWPETWKKIFYKAYPRFEQIVLPRPSKRKFDLYKALIERKSYRVFSEELIKLYTFSDLLYYSIGMRNLLKKDVSTRRFYPSAGARYPLEIYPVVFNVDKLKPAIYHYHFKNHSLEKVLGKPFSRSILKCFSQSWIRKSAVLVIITAIFDRTEIKYGNRGYRHILTEHGHICQNLYLASTSLKLGCCSVGGFIERGLNKLLDIDGIDESVVGAVAIGKKSKE